MRDVRNHEKQNIPERFGPYLCCIPNDELFANGQPVRVGKTLFEKQSQASSMRVELGWAFFTRMDACLETLVHELKIQSGGTGILQYLENNGCTLSEHEKDGLSVYREIRNTLHHGDGNPVYLKNSPKTLNVGSGNEPHLFEEQKDMFYKLFKKVGEFLTKPSTHE